MFELLHYIDQDAFFSENFEYPDFNLVVRLNTDEFTRRKYPATFFSKEGKGKIAFHLEVTKYSDPKQVFESLFLFFLHPGYLKTIFKPVIFCDDTENDFIKELVHLLSQQKLFPQIIQVNSVNDKISIRSSASLAFLLNGNISYLSEMAAQIFVTDVYFRNLFFLVQNEHTDADNRILITMESLAKGMSLEPAHLLNIIQKQAALINKKNERIIVLNEQLCNTKDFLRYYQKNDNSKEVNDFYHYEYEILPLWYKRLGHIIKVIMGKRTLRSLFNDNVKKYKN
jgi:hypothetical protein